MRLRTRLGSVYLFITKLELWQKLLLLTVPKTAMHVSYTCDILLPKRVVI